MHAGHAEQTQPDASSGPLRQLAEMPAAAAGAAAKPPRNTQVQYCMTDFLSGMSIRQSFSLLRHICDMRVFQQSSFTQEHIS